MPVATARTDPRPAAPGRTRTWGWVAHLESGGTLPWTTWRERDDADGPAEARWPPGAQQLELLRRLNQAGRPDPGLVRRVLAAPAIGRGRHDLALDDADARPGFGPAPVDPADLTDDDLLRVAVGLLAGVLTDSSAVSPDDRGAKGQTNRSVRRLRTRYRLVGDPELADPRRAALVADGRPPGGTGARVLVLGTDLATMLGHAWVAGTFAEGGPSWPDFLSAWEQRGGVPRRVDLPAIADRWRADGSTGGLDVVLTLDSLPGLLRLRPRSRLRLSTPPPIAASAAELARHTTIALGLLAPGDRSTALRAMLADSPGPPPLVPPEHQAWVAARAGRMADRLARSAHRIVGDPDSLVPSPQPPQPSQPSPEGAQAAASPLELAVVLLLGGHA